MKKFIVVSLSVLLVVGLVAGTGLAFRGHGSRMHRDFAREDLESVDRFEELTEEEIAELKEVDRQMFRLAERISVLREEYRQAIIDGASDNELDDLEDQLFELQDEMAELSYDSDFRGFHMGNRRGDTGFGGMMRGFMGSSRGSGTHCW